MKLRFFVVALAAATLTLAGCGDDITNIIEDIATPTAGTPPTQQPTNTVAPPTNTPPPTNTGVPGTPTETRTPGEETPICGDGVTVAPETCDDGGLCADAPETNCTSPDDCPSGKCLAVGGDGCAANCTVETQDHNISADFAPGSGSTVQTAIFPISISLTGTQTVQAGDKRDDAVIDVNGDTTFNPGDIPIIVKADDVLIDPVIVTGLVCACVRGIEVPFFGPGNSATGKVACGEQESSGFDYILYQDHNTDGDGFSGTRNPACAEALDPQCEAEFVFPSGVVSHACREGQDPDCADLAVHPHPGVCNSPRVIEFSDATGPRGSAIINNNTAIGLLSDGGKCDLTIAGRNPCPYPAYGPDCIPCTDDDLDMGVPENIPTTTGTAKAVIYDVNNNLGRTLQQGTGQACTVPAQGEVDPCIATTPEGLCGGPEKCFADKDEQGQPLPTGTCGITCGNAGCVTSSTGHIFDCDVLLDDPANGLSGGSLAVTFPSIDANLILDNTTTTRFVFE